MEIDEQAQAAPLAVHIALVTRLCGELVTKYAAAQGIDPAPVLDTLALMAEATLIDRGITFDQWQDASAHVGDTCVSSVRRH